MMPTLAQGAAISLEDGFALARNLAQHRDDPSRGLAAYEAERRPRASRVVLQAREQFQNNRKNPAPPPLSRDWIFAHDATVDTRTSRVEARRSDFAAVVGPMQQCLALAGPAEQIARFAVLLHLADMAADRLPALDLAAVLLRHAAAHV